MEIKLIGQVFGVEQVPSGKGSAVRAVCDLSGDAQACKFFVPKEQTPPKVGTKVQFTLRVQPAFRGFGIEGRLLSIAPAQ